MEGNRSSFENNRIGKKIYGFCKFQQLKPTRACFIIFIDGCSLSYNNAITLTLDIVLCILLFCIVLLETIVLIFMLSYYSMKLTIVIVISPAFGWDRGRRTSMSKNVYYSILNINTNYPLRKQ